MAVSGPYRHFFALFFGCKTQIKFLLEPKNKAQNRVQGQKTGFLFAQAHHSTQFTSATVGSAAPGP
jgi:hypothetical protein